MDLSVGARLTAYVEGFFPSSYDVTTTVCMLEGARAPLVSISIASPNGGSAFHDAYQHQILDICYMAKVADHLRQVACAGLPQSWPLIHDRRRDLQGNSEVQNSQQAQQRRGADVPAGLQKKAHI